MYTFFGRPIAVCSSGLSIHATLSQETRGLIDVRRFGLMKPTAYLINTARGPIVDEGALCAALLSGQIAGAGLDVFDEEPLPPQATQSLKYRMSS